MTKPSRTIRLANASYRALLWLYPPRFRREYGAEMAYLFADLSRDAGQQNGTWGVLGLFARAVVDTIYNSIGEWAMTLRKHWGGILLTVTGFAALAAMWFFTFAWMNIYTVIFLVPWDTTLTRPPEGTLAQFTNDFFSGPGAYILSFVVLAINAALFVRALRRGADAAALPWKFAFASLIFIVGSYGLVTLGIHIGGAVWPYPVGRSDPGFHRSVFPSLMFIVSFLLYLKLLSRFARQGRNLTLDGGMPYKTVSENER
jgi:hypothetical protein